MEDWGRLLSDFDYCVIEKTPLYGTQISTVWLGLNHQYTDGPPLIFETMVFGGPLSHECFRWPTEEQAQRGHTHVVRLLESGEVLLFHAKLIEDGQKRHNWVTWARGIRRHYRKTLLSAK